LDDYRDGLERHYLPLLRQFGVDHQAVGWGSSESQRLRFGVLLEVGDVRRASILDVGCGIGHLVDYLSEAGFGGNYRGIDLLEEMVAEARRRHPDRRFEIADVGAAVGVSADYVVSSGLFTFADRERLHGTVEAMFAASSKGTAFNSLSAWAEKQDAGEFHADPLETVEFCRTLTPWVVLRHDYHPRDFTIYMYRNERP